MLSLWKWTVHTHLCTDGVKIMTSNRSSREYGQMLCTWVNFLMKFTHLHVFPLVSIENECANATLENEYKRQLCQNILTSSETINFLFLFPYSIRLSSIYLYSPSAICLSVVKVYKVFLSSLFFYVWGLND